MANTSLIDSIISKEHAKEIVNYFSFEVRQFIEDILKFKLDSNTNYFVNVVLWSHYHKKLFPIFTIENNLSPLLFSHLPEQLKKFSFTEAMVENTTVENIYFRDDEDITNCIKWIEYFGENAKFRSKKIVDFIQALEETHRVSITNVLSSSRVKQVTFTPIQIGSLIKTVGGVFAINTSTYINESIIKEIQQYISRLISVIPIAEIEYNYLNTLRNNVISSVMSRNFSHNIGSHVMHNADLGKITAKLNQNISEFKSVADELNAHRYAAALKSLLDRYIVQRNEYLADVSEATMPAGNYAKFYAEVVMPFVENFLLTDNIAAAEGIGFSSPNRDNRLQIRVFIESKELITLYDASIEDNILNDGGKLLESGIMPGYPNWGVIKSEGEALRMPFQLPFKTTGAAFKELGDPLKLFQSNQLEAFFHTKKIIARDERNGEYSINDDESGDVEVALPGVLGKHAFYSLLENFIRNSAKHNKEALKNENLNIHIRLSALEKADLESGRFDSKYDAWKVSISDNGLSVLSQDQFEKLEGYVNAPLITSQTGEPRTTGLGIADMVVSASVLAGSFDFDFSDTKQRNKYLHIEKVAEKEADKWTFQFSFYLLKAKRVICLTTNKRSDSDPVDWQAHGITFVQSVEELYHRMGRQAYQMAVLDADLLDKEFGDNTDKYEELLSRLPFRIIIKDAESEKNAQKHWHVLCKQRRVVVFNRPFAATRPAEFRRFCWEQWLLLFYPALRKSLPIQLHLYLEHKHPRWEAKEKESYNGLLDLHVYHPDKPVQYQHREGAVNLIYDHHGRLLQSMGGKANFLDSDSYAIFDKNSADFPRLMYPDNNTLEVLPYMMAEAGLLRVLVMDERVSERSNWDADMEGKPLGDADPLFVKTNGRKNDSVFELAWAGGIHIATHYQINDEGERPLNDKIAHRPDAPKLTLHIKTESGKPGKIWMSSNLGDIKGKQYHVEDGHYDMLLIHRSILKHIQESVHKIQKDEYGMQRPDFEFLRDIKNLIPFTVVDSGGGYPDEIRQEYEGSFKFLPFSFMSEHLLRNRIAKVGLAQLLLGLTDAKHV